MNFHWGCFFAGLLGGGVGFLIGAAMHTAYDNFKRGIDKLESRPRTLPIDMILFCPHCRAQHIDAPDPGAGWFNPPHRSHKCKSCRTIWRPADVATNGVASIKTRGKTDTMTFAPPS